MPSTSTPSIDSNRSRALRRSIHGWLAARHRAKTEKLAPDDPARAKFADEFEPSAWLDDAARRASQIQSVTHALKHTHPDARGTSLHVRPGDLPAIDAVGSHALGDDFAPDIVGNAAALDIAAFLGQRFDGRTLLELAASRDPDFLSALSDRSTQAESWASAFAAVASPRGRPSGHTLGKQVLWRVGDDPCDDAAFEQFLILTPTSLVHRLYEATQADRFGDDAKAAREARKAQRHDERPVRIYNDLAVHKLGGTKPQNLSQLNSQRRGQNPLLASLPPVWRSADVRPILGPTTMFSVIAARDDVGQALKRLIDHLRPDPRNVVDTRRQRAELVDWVIDEFVAFSQQYDSLAAGWTRDPACRLPEHERRWLDPHADRAAAAQGKGADIAGTRVSVVEVDLEDDSSDDLPARDFSGFSGRSDDGGDGGGSGSETPDDGEPSGPIHPVVREMAASLGIWINDRLRRGGVEPVGDDEARHWRKQALGPLRDSWELRA